MVQSIDRIHGGGGPMITCWRQTRFDLIINFSSSDRCRNVIRRSVGHIIFIRSTLYKPTGLSRRRRGHLQSPPSSLPRRPSRGRDSDRRRRTESSQAERHRGRESRLRREDDLSGKHSSGNLWQIIITVSLSLPSSSVFHHHHHLN